MTATIDRRAAYRAKVAEFQARLSDLERQRAAHLSNGRRHLAERLNVSIDSLETALAYHQWRGGGGGGGTG
mgnify:CR=1 FL=1